MSDSRNRMGQRCMYRASGRVAIPLTMLGVFPFFVASVVAQTPNSPAAVFRESVSLDTDSTVVKQLRTARDYLVREQWEPAFEVLHRIASQESQTLVSLSPGRYVTAGTYCNLLLCALPAEGLAAYRKTVDADAKRLFETGRKKRDSSTLRKLVANAFVSSYGDDALLLLGEWSWQRGDISAARRLWTQAFPLQRDIATGKSSPALRYPDSDHNHAEILARLILCSLTEGNVARAKLEIAAFERLHPNTEGFIAGKRGKLVEIIREVRKETDQWQYDRLVDDVRTFGGNVQRNAIAGKAVDVGVVAANWTIRLQENRYRPASTRPALPDRGPLSYHPVVFDGNVFLNDEDRIHAFDLQTGKPAWTEADGNETSIYPAVPAERSPFPTRPMTGIPRYTMTISEGRLYARMGSPITERSQHELANLESHIVCLDLIHGEGKLVRKFFPPGDRKHWAFEGSPAVVEGRMYVALRKGQPETQANVACFDAETGRLIWNRKICAAVSPVLETHNFLSHQLVTVAEDTVYYSTGLGAIAALDAEDGTIRWIVTYEANRRANQQELSDHTKIGLTPCVFHQGIVVAVPNDSNRIMVIDSATGIVNWERSFRGGVRHVLGVRNHMLIVGGNQLWGLNIDTGKIMWHKGYEEPAGFGYGRGVLVKNYVYWPTREEVLVVDHATGRIVEQVRLRDSENRPLSTGNLFVANGVLLVASPDRITAFRKVAGRKQPRFPEFTLQHRDHNTSLLPARKFTPRLDSAD